MDKLKACPFCGEVNSDTVRLYTGIKDKDGTAICEGDILGGTVGGYVVYLDNEARFAISVAGELNEVRFEDLYPKDLIVVGNIWDDPELLEGWGNARARGNKYV